jgi:hypothetical protein
MAALQLITGEIECQLDASFGFVNFQVAGTQALRFHTNSDVHGLDRAALQINSDATCAFGSSINANGPITSSGILKSTGGETFENRPRLDLIDDSASGAVVYLGMNNEKWWSPLTLATDGTLRSHRIIGGFFNYQTVNAQGYVTFNGGTNASSDARLKDSVEDLPEEAALGLLKAVSAKTYVRNDMVGSDRRCGFIAQEVEAAAHESLGKNLVGSIPSLDTPGEETKTLSYERMAVVLWQCTRSLLARVEALEAQLAQP